MTARRGRAVYTLDWSCHLVGERNQWTIERKRLWNTVLTLAQRISCIEHARGTPEQQLKALCVSLSLPRILHYAFDEVVRDMYAILRARAEQPLSVRAAIARLPILVHTFALDNGRAVLCLQEGESRSER